MKYLQFKNQIATVILILVSFSAFSQVVNIEKKRSNKKKGLEGKTELAFSYKKNNSEILSLKNSLSVYYFNNQHTILLFDNVNILKAQNKDLINNSYVHLRYNYNFKDSIFIFETFSQYQFNQLRKLKKRILYGIGPRIRIVEKENFSLFLGAPLMYEYEELTNNLGINNNIKVDFYTSISYNISKNINLNGIIYYQPIINNFNTYRLAGEANIQTTINKHLALKLSYNHNFDSHPPTDITNLDSQILLKIVVMF